MFELKNHSLSEPTHDGDPIDGCLPIQNGQVNFIDVTKDGLKLDVNPNQAANELWARIDQQIHEIETKNKKE